MIWTIFLVLPLVIRCFVLPTQVPPNVQIRGIFGTKEEKTKKINAYLTNLDRRGIDGKDVKKSFLELNTEKDLETDKFYEYIVNLTSQLYLNLYLSQAGEEENVNGYKVLCVISKNKDMLEQVMNKSTEAKIQKKARKLSCIVHEKILNEDQFNRLGCKREPGSWAKIIKTRDNYYKAYCLVGLGNITNSYHKCFSMAKRLQSEEVSFLSTFE